jgi:Uma2 family endonuclease
MPILIDVLSEAPVNEILDGRVYRKMSPNSRHARVQYLLAGVFERCGREIGMAGTEWDFRVGVVEDSNTFLVPDVAFVRYDRLTTLAAEDREQPPIAPDVVAEVRSKGEKAGFRKRKIARYRACGTVLVLDADPATRRLDAHTKDCVRAYAHGERFEHPAVPWLVFDVAETFRGLEYLSK